MYIRDYLFAMFWLICLQNMQSILFFWLFRLIFVWFSFFPSDEIQCVSNILSISFMWETFSSHVDLFWLICAQKMPNLFWALVTLFAHFVLPICSHILLNLCKQDPVHSCAYINSRAPLHKTQFVPNVLFNPLLLETICSLVEVMCISHAQVSNYFY